MTEKSSSRFPGPRPYEEDQHHLFFGREREVERMLNATFDRLGVLSAESGAGKSSLLAAGYIPELRRLRAMNAKRGAPPVLLLRAWGGREADAEARICDGVIEAVDDLEDRSRKWAKVAPTLSDATARKRAEDISGSIANDHKNLKAIIDSLSNPSMTEVLDALSREEGLILILDQFEEFMGSASAEAGSDQRSAEKVTKAVGRVFRDLPKLRILIALRTEYCRTLQRYLNFYVPNLDRRVIDLSPLPPRSIAEIVKGVCSSEPEKIRQFADEVGKESGATEDDSSNVSVLEVQALLHGYDAWCTTEKKVSDFTLDFWEEYRDSLIEDATFLWSTMVRPRRVSGEASVERAGRVALKRWVKDQLKLAIADSGSESGVAVDHDERRRRAYWMLLPILPRLSTQGGYKQHLNLLDLFLDLADRLSEGWGKSETVTQCFDSWLQNRPGRQQILDASDLRKLMQELGSDSKRSTEERAKVFKEMEEKRDQIQQCIIEFNSTLRSLQKKGILKMSGRGKEESCELVHDGLSEHVRRWAQDLPKSAETVLGSPVEVVGERFAWQELDGGDATIKISKQKWAGCSLKNGARVTNVTFEGCDFRGLSLTGCILENVTFKNCKMPGAIMIGCTLTRTKFEHCDLTSTAFIRCVFIQKIEFSGELPKLGGTSDRKMNGLSMNNMTGVDFAGCTLQHTSSIKFTQCLLRFAKIGKIRIESGSSVGFEKCDMMNAWVEDAGLPSVGVDQYCRTIGLLSFEQPLEGWLDRENRG